MTSPLPRSSGVLLAVWLILLPLGGLGSFFLLLWKRRREDDEDAVTTTATNTAAAQA